MSQNEVITGQEAVATAKRLLRENLPPRWKLFALSLFCMIGVAGFTGALAYSTKLIVNDVFVAENTSSAYWVAGLVMFVAIGKAGFQYANAVIAVYIQRSILANYQKRLFRHQLSQNVSYYLRVHSSAQMAKIRLFSQASSRTVTNLCNKFLTELITLIALFVVMLLQDPLMTIMGCIIIPLVGLLVTKLSKRVRATAAAENELTGAYFSLGAEAMDGIKTVKSYHLEDKSIGRFEAAVEKLQDRLFGIAKITSATLPIMEVLGGVIIGLFVVYASWQTITNGKTPGEFTAFITAFLLAYQPAEKVSKIWVDMQKSLVHANRMYRGLDRKSTTDDTATLDLADAEPSIRFKNVSFKYPKGEKVFHDVSFDIHAGERIAIVGQSGAGKSTLIDLLQRFFDPTNGAIKIGDTNIKKASEDSVRRYFALISQDVFLFDGTIRENIQDGNPDATEEQIRQAATFAQLDDLIGRLPEGIDGPVGPNGRALSGGQKQRVGIARAIAKNAKIFVFDEATSALDSQNERLIMTKLNEVLGDATLLFVTHRASTLAYVDRVIVMENGRVAAFDTPDALLKSNPEYRALFHEE